MILDRQMVARLGEDRSDLTSSLSESEPRDDQANGVMLERLTHSDSESSSAAQFVTPATGTVTVLA